MAGPVLAAETWEKGGQMPLHSQTQKSFCPRPGHGMSVWPEPRPEEPGLVCALGEWPTVLARWGALGLAPLQGTGIIQKWAGAAQHGLGPEPLGGPAS